MTHILLVGNPNCGKTTLFNALTGDNQRVGNWPGVTVEKKTGAFSMGTKTIRVTDLPGIYSLTVSDNTSQDERITAHALVSLSADIIINVIDACHLERHLYITSQLLELGKPVIVALNMMDIASERGITIDLNALSQQLHCPVVALQAHKKRGISDLKTHIINPQISSSPLTLPLPVEAKRELNELTQYVMNAQQLTPKKAGYFACRIMEGDTLLGANVFAKPVNHHNDYDIIFADARYQCIHHIMSMVHKKHSDASEHLTAKIDKIVLNRYAGLPLFFLMMYLMFLFAINIGGAFQDFFDISTNAIFVQGSASILQYLHAPAWFIALIANGIGTGINTTLTFIPVIAAMFFFLALLETSGYMARAAFVVDRVMRALGLPGKSFVPMIVGFGCNVPAIMAARTLDCQRDRLLTILMSPFMSCSARLAIYAVFVAAFFPAGGQNIVFALYMTGIMMAVLTGFMLRKTLLKGQASPLILELPAYHRPALGRLLRETGLRLRFFITRASRMIIPVCVILGGLNALTITGGFSGAMANTQSVLSLVGQWLTPLFSPIGLHQDNWPATVGLLTGMLAKEVVVGSLNTLYAQSEQFHPLGMATGLDIIHALQAAVWSIWDNLAGLSQALFNPILASAPDNDVSQSMYGVMASRFDGQAGAFSYLLFILLYIPCISTMAAIRQEASRKLMWFSIVWSFLVAYTAALSFYQIARFMEHPWASLLWIIAMMMILSMFVGLLRYRST